jgi:CBS domain-containing protein
MVKHDIGRLPVMKENKLVGIITRTDAMRYFYDLLPE